MLLRNHWKLETPIKTVKMLKKTVNKSHPFKTAHQS